MSRNKYPEETRQLIIDVSTKLFMENSYEKTSLQDIINHLGGLTKGAIYHHFKSKEEILYAVVNHICNDNVPLMSAIRDDKSLTGKERLEKMFAVSLQNPNQKDVFAITPNLLDNPTFLSYYIKMVVSDTVPYYIVPVIRAGVADGSITTNYPEELSDLIMFLSDVWLNPLIFQMSGEQLVRKAKLLNQMLQPFGIQVLSDDLIMRLTQFQTLAELK